MQRAYALHVRLEEGDAEGDDDEPKGQEHHREAAADLGLGREVPEAHRGDGRREVVPDVDAAHAALVSQQVVPENKVAPHQHLPACM